MFPFEFIECNDVGGLMLLSLSSPFTADIIDITFNGFIDCFVTRSLMSRFLSPGIFNHLVDFIHTVADFLFRSFDD